MSESRPQSRNDEDIEREIATLLMGAWSEYTVLYGIPPRGTFAQLHSMLALQGAGRKIIALCAASEKPAQLAPPTEAEIAWYRDIFRAELDKRMDTNHPSGSPSTEAHAVALRNFVEKRNAANR